MVLNCCNPYLEKVLNTDYQPDLPDTLRRGITAAQAGHKTEARALLTTVVEADESQVEAWRWLSRVVDSLEDKIICLENLLTLEPENQAARRHLAQAKAAQAHLFAPPYPADIDQPRAVPNIPEAAKMPVTTDYPHKNEFDDEWLCVYCAAPTSPTNRRCPACHRSLVARRRAAVERTLWLWRGVTLQLIVAFLLFSFGVTAYILVGKRAGVPNPLPLLPAYAGLSVAQPAGLVGRMLAAFPPATFWGLVGGLGYTLGLGLMLYVRLPYGHFIHMINAGLMLLVGLFSPFVLSGSLWGAVPGAALFFIGGAQFLITLNLWNDFTFKEGRIKLKIDSGAKNHQTLYLSGRKYSELGMWGLAVIHLRRAVGRSDKVAMYHLALALAYFKINRPDLAEPAIAQAEKLGASLEADRLRRALGAR
jgi:tetratricopeptide (TPR) repeat protein